MVWLTGATKRDVEGSSAATSTSLIHLTDARGEGFDLRIVPLRITKTSRKVMDTRGCTRPKLLYLRHDVDI